MPSVSPTSLCHGLSQLASQLGPALSPQQGHGHVGATGGISFVGSSGPVRCGSRARTQGRETAFPPQNAGERQKGSAHRASHTINTAHAQEPGAIFACRKPG